MNNRKIEERLSELESNLDDVWFWVFIVAILLGFSVVKFGSIPSPQTSSTTTQTSTFQPSKDAPKFIYPLPTKVSISSGYGMRTHPITGKQTMHSGVDLGMPTGTPIFSVADGVVESSGSLGNCGYGVRVQHSGGYMSVYCHASKLLVKSGQSVKSGETIALVGSTGMSTGPHLHLGMKLNGEWIDPKKIVPLE